jgi:hypothetical protein
MGAGPVAAQRSFSRVSGGQPVGLHRVTAAARSLGVLAANQPVTSLNMSNDGLAVLQAALPDLTAKLSAMHRGPSADVLRVLEDAAGEGIRTMRAGALVHALQVARQHSDEGGIALVEAEVTGEEEVKVAYDDPILDEFFSFHSFSGTASSNLSSIHESGHSRTFKIDATEGVWVTRLEGFGPMRSLLEDIWVEGARGVLVYRNPRTRSVGIISVVGTVRTPWADNLMHSLGGVMALTKSLKKGSRAAVEKSVDMIKWMAIQLRLNRLNPGNLSSPGRQVGLGPGKSIVMYDPARGKSAALAIHAQVMKEFALYIGGNDEGVGVEEASLISAIAPRKFAGHAVADFAGFFPSLHTADGVFEALLVAIEEHINDRHAPCAILGYGGVGSRIAANMELGSIRVSGIIDGNAKNLKRAASRHAGVPLVFSLAGAAQLFQAGSAQYANHVAMARSAGFIIARDLVDALENPRLQGTRLLSDNGGPNSISREYLEWAKDNQIGATVGGANNPFADPALAALAVNGNHLVYDPRFINSLGATAVLGLVLDFGPALMQQHIMAIREESKWFYEMGHAKGISPSDLGMVLMAQLWNEMLDRGEASGPRYPVPDIAFAA